MAVPQTPWAAAGVLAQLVVTLAGRGVLTGTEPYDIFDGSTPVRVRSFAGGAFSCLCLGVDPGQPCGNGGVGDDFTAVFLDATQPDLDTRFHPTRTPSRSGWVAVPQQPHLPLSVLLQLVRLLTDKGMLTWCDGSWSRG